MNEIYSIFSDIADTIRNKLSVSSTFTPAQMVTEIENMAQGPSVVEPFQYRNSTISKYAGNEICILDYAFNSCSRLKTASFPNCSYIGAYAFTSCSTLSTASFPNCSYIGTYAFSYCYNLTTASFPNCSYIGYSAFEFCMAITTASFPNCSYIGNSAFAYCSSLTTVSFPNCSYIGAYAFYNCGKLTTASFPNCSSIGAYAFQVCTKLSSLYLLTSSVPSLTTSNTFSSSPLSAGGSGKIYVKSSLLSSFKTATNWSKVSARLVGM